MKQALLLMMDMGSASSKDDLVLATELVQMLSENIYHSSN